MFNMFFDYRYLSPLTLIATDASETLGDVYFYEFTYYNKDIEQGGYPEWTGKHYYSAAKGVSRTKLMKVLTS